MHTCGTALPSQHPLQLLCSFAIPMNGPRVSCHLSQLTTACLKSRQCKLESVLAACKNDIAFSLCLSSVCMPTLKFEVHYLVACSRFVDIFLEYEYLYKSSHGF